jgi:hypothetical protein
VVQKSKRTSFPRRRLWSKPARTVTVIALLAAMAGLSAFAGCSCQTVAKKTAGSTPKKPVSAVTTCPLCGRKVQDAALIDRRPVAVKVENDPAARPQSGLDKACVVYEELTEGGVTRFMAIYLCTDADPVGPVRSARPADIEIVFPYYALFAHCGAGRPVMAMIKQAGLLDIDELSWGGAFWRTHDRRAPHNLYTSTARIRQAGDTAFPYRQVVSSPFQFMDAKKLKDMAREREAEQQRAAQASKQGTPYKPRLSLVNSVVIPYASPCTVTYDYDPATMTFTRYVAGVPHRDLTTGQQLTADTVIVQYVTMGSSGIKDVNGAESPELGVIGSGRAQVFVAGRVIDANWQKSSRAEHTRFVDNSGKVIPIKPGSTWIELVPADRQAALS